LLTSKTITDAKHKARAAVAGLVICRQRPMTASGVVFMTLEDEWGFLNLVLWERVFTQYRHVAVSSRLLLVHGRVEKSSGVIHVIADSLEPIALPTLAGNGDHDADIPSMSRDFH
jgi:DNA polymerase III alpha subunit